VVSSLPCAGAGNLLGSWSACWRLGERAEGVNGTRPQSSTLACSAFGTPPLMRGDEPQTNPCKTNTGHSAAAWDALADDLRRNVYTERNCDRLKQWSVPKLPLPRFVGRGGDKKFRWPCGQTEASLPSLSAL